MNWKLVVLAAAFTSSAGSVTWAGDLVVSGSVQATWRQPQKINIGPDAVLRAGHSVTVRVSGQVDINQERRSRRRCAVLGMLGCKTTEWIEHHPVGPDTQPILVEIRRVGSTTAMAQRVVGAAPAVLSVPEDQDFTAEFEIVGILNGAGTSVDPGRSGGAYKVDLEVDATQRANAFAGWMRTTGVTLDVALSAEALDAALLAGHAVRVAEVLRNHAKTVYPVPGPVPNREPHERLLRKAVVVAPGEAANSLALADYFRALGLHALADEQIKKSLAELEAKTDPRSRALLGQTYWNASKSTIAKFGGMDTASIEEASALLEKAANAYKASRRRDLEAAVLVDRARLLRGLRSREALTVASRLLEEAASLTPDSIKAKGFALGPDIESVFRLNWRHAFRIGEIQGGGMPSQDVMDELIVGFDPIQGRFLVNRGGALGWRSADSPASLQPTAIGPGFRYQVANGAILAMPSPNQLIYAAPNGDLMPIKFGTVDTCPKVAGPPPPPGMQQLPPSEGLTASLGRNGDIVAFVCGDSLSIHQLRPDGLRSAHSQKLAAPYPAGQIVVRAGDAQCGALVALQPTIGALTPAFPPALIKVDGTLTRLQLPQEMPGPPGPGFPRPPGSPPGIWNAEFSGDGKVLIPSHREIGVFDCRDGSAAGSIALPAIGNPTNPGLSLPILNRIDRSTIAVMDPGGTISLLRWPERELRPAPMPERVRQKQGEFGFAIVGPRNAGEPPRFVEYERVVTAGPLGRNANDPGTFALPFVSTRQAVLSGGTYLLSEGPRGAPIVKHLSGQVSDTLPPGNRTMAMPVARKDGWAALRMKDPTGPGGMDWWLAKIEQFQGTGAAFAMDAPSATIAELAAIRDVFRKFVVDVWSKMPTDQQRSFPGEDHFFERKNFQKLVDDPSRLKIRYRPGGRTEPLMASGVNGSHLLCPFVTATDDAGNEKIPAAFPGIMALELSPLLVTYPEGAPVITRLPPMTANCGLVAVSGHRPAVLKIDFGPTGLDMKWLRGGNWVDVWKSAEPSHVAAASVLADGSLLFLVPSGPPNSKNLPSAFALKKASGAGPATDACPACGKIDLNAAFQRLRNTDLNEPSSLEDFHLRSLGPFALLQVNASGDRMTYPDGDEIVVQSLSRNGEILRTKLGIPYFLGADLLAIGSGNGRFELHKLPAP